MTNLTRKEIIEAHNAIERLANLAMNPIVYKSKGYVVNEYKEKILAALPPKPELTMEDIDWDPDDYYLVEAKHPNYGTVLMIEKSIYTGLILIAAKDESGVRCINVEPKELTLIGK